jgi:hypothetical protein
MYTIQLKDLFYPFIKHIFAALYYTTLMENKQALQILEKQLKALEQKKLAVTPLIADLKKLREISLEFNNPVVTKSLRLAYEHLEANNDFLIGIPADEPINEDDLADTQSNVSAIESLQYYLSLFTDLNKKNNILDLKEYNAAFLAQ